MKTVTFPVRLPEALHEAARQVAFNAKISLHRLILEAIVAELERREPAGKTEASS